MKLFLCQIPLLLISAFFTVSTAQAAEQCIQLNGKYQARVDWYKSADILIDNSEPWNNRLKVRKSTAKGQGRCGPDATTGEQVCEGFPVKPASSVKLKPLGTTSSCVNGGGDMFAVVTCLGCSRGNEILSAGLGAVANLALPSYRAIKFLGVVGTATGYTPVAASKAIFKEAQKSLKARSKTNVALVIHDISDFPNAADIIYVGTPQDVRLGGNFKSAVGNEIADIRNTNESYSLAIDCEHSDLDANTTNTSDTITVEWWAGNSKMLETSHFNDITCSSRQGNWTRWIGQKLPKAPSRVVVRSNGNDAFYMDEVKLQLWRDGRILGPNLLASSGAKDGRGWCLSNDPNDINGSFKNFADSCKSSNSFSVAGSQSQREKACYNLVQGKIAWNRKGAKTWNDGNVKKLCANVKNPRKRVSCFDNLVQQAGLPWNAAIPACQKH